MDSTTKRTEEGVRQLAEEIAHRLFTNGSRQEAERLVLTIDGPPKRDLGGWCRRAAADQIEEILRKAGVTRDEMASASTEESP